MSTTVADSYAHCTRQARDAASNFYYAFYLLPRAKREAMCALYAFLRRTDDLGDSDEPLETRHEPIVTDRIIRATTLTGTAEEIVASIRAMRT